MACQKVGSGRGSDDAHAYFMGAPSRTTEKLFKNRIICIRKLDHFQNYDCKQKFSKDESLSFWSWRGISRFLRKCSEKSWKCWKIDSKLQIPFKHFSRQVRVWIFSFSLFTFFYYFSNFAAEFRRVSTSLPSLSNGLRIKYICTYFMHNLRNISEVSSSWKVPLLRYSHLSTPCLTIWI